MEKLIERWLRELESLEIPHNLYDKTIDQWLEDEKKHFEQDKDPVHLMLAFNEALEFEQPIPRWVIEGLNNDKKFQKYRHFPEDKKIEFLPATKLMVRWGLDDPVSLASHIWNDGLGYYVISGKWMSEVAQAFLKKEITTCKGKRVRPIADGWTWVDAGEITLNKLLENLDHLRFSMEDVIEFEKKHAFIAETPNENLHQMFEYAFLRTGPTWKIVYDGREHAGLKGPGFKYLHYLIQNSPEEIEVKELFRMFEKDSATEKKMDGLGLDDSCRESDTYETNLEIWDAKTIKDVKEEIEDLEERIREAEQNNDFYKKEKLTRELEELKRHYEGTQFHGKLKTFVTNEKKMIQNIGRAMERAIDKIASDNEAYDHFRNAFLPFTSEKPKSYNPVKKIRWKLE